MIIPEWDNKHQAWDRYSAFHMGIHRHGLTKTASWNYPPFILFDTGELICTVGRPGPDLRTRYSALNIQLTCSKDTLFATPDGEPIPKAWLGQGGMTYAMVDLDTKRAVRLSDWQRMRENTNPICPERLRDHAYAYVAGASRAAVGVPFDVRPPLRKTLTRDELKHVDNLCCAFRAAVSMIPDHEAKTSRTGYWPNYQPLPVEALLAISSTNELDTEQQQDLYRKGVARKSIPHDYLLVRGA